MEDKTKRTFGIIWTCIIIGILIFYLIIYINTKETNYLIGIAIFLILTIVMLRDLFSKTSKNRNPKT